MDRSVKKRRLLLMSPGTIIIAILFTSNLRFIHSSIILNLPNANRNGVKDGQDTVEETQRATMPHIMPVQQHMRKASEVTTPIFKQLLVTEHRGFATKRKYWKIKRVHREVESVTLWPNATIPYVISSNFSNNEKTLLQSAMETYQRYTCVRFRRALTEDQHFVKITYSHKCASFVGRVGGAQEFFMGANCHMGKSRAFLHQLGHVIGLSHVQSREDRDNFVVVNDNNANVEDFPNIRKLFKHEANTHDVKYSYLSIMHDSIKAFSANGKPTIVPKVRKYLHHMGKLDQLVFEDVQLINKMYGCAGHCGRETCQVGGYLGPDCHCWCPSTNDSKPAVPCPESLRACPAMQRRAHSSQVISSPGFPTMNYPNRLNCIWIVRGQGESLLLNVTSFSTEERFDHVRIFDRSGLIKELSGANEPFILVVKSPSRIVFTSDDLATGTGFQIIAKSMNDITSLPPFLHYKAPNELSTLPTGTLSFTVTTRLPNPYQFEAAINATRLKIGCYDVAMTDVGRLWLRTWTGTLLELSDKGEQLSHVEPRNLTHNFRDFFNNMVVLSGNRVAVSTNVASAVVIFTRTNDREDMETLAWREERRIQLFPSTPVSLAVYQDIFAMTVIRRGEYPSTMEEGRQLALVNISGPQWVEYLSRDYDVTSVALTADAVITVGKATRSSGCKVDVVDAHSLSRNDNRLWRYVVSSDDENVEDVHPDFEGRILYLAILKRDRSSGRVAAISMDNGIEIRPNVLDNGSLSQPISIALGTVNRKVFLVVLGWNIKDNSFSTLTWHPAKH